MKALFALQHSPSYVHADQDLRAITEGVRQSAAGADLARLDELGPLALAVFGYVCKQGGQGVKKPFSAAALDEYSVELGRPVGAEEIQKVATMLVDSNILVRDGHAAEPLVPGTRTFGAPGHTSWVPPNGSPGDKNPQIVTPACGIRGVHTVSASVFAMQSSD